MDVSFDCEFNLFANFEPTSFEEYSTRVEWKEAMQNEYDALMNNATLNLVDPVVRAKPIGFKWVYKNKYNSYGSTEKHKARLVEKGYA